VILTFAQKKGQLGFDKRGGVDLQNWMKWAFS